MRAKGFSLSVAGFSVRFVLHSKKMSAILCSHYRESLTGGRNPGLIIDCWFSKKKYSGRAKVSVSRTGKKLRKTSRRDFACTWSGKFGTAWVYPAISSFDACIRTVFATELPYRNALLFHGAGIAEKRRAFLFAGVSGSGKSTLARLHAGKKVLTDEISCVSLSGLYLPKIYATPFWGELGSGRFYEKSFPLKKIFLLKKSKTNRQIPIQAPSDLPQILRCVCTFSNDPEDLLQILKVALKLIRKVPLFVLCFKKDNTIIDYLWK